MATINGLYVFVESEEISRENDVSSYDTETGLPLTDKSKTKPVTLSIKGKIVSHSNTYAYEILRELRKIQKSGELVTYRGRNICKNFKIQSFNTTHPNTNSKGADFTMTLREEKQSKVTIVQSETPKKTYTTDFKVGDIVVFKGGNVYVSSDATKPAANRGRSTCTITIINERSWSKHDYHLISRDSGMVYGWVDLENIEPKVDVSTKGETDGDYAQVDESEGLLFYTTREWDSIERICLIANLPQELFVKLNPYAFEDINDIRTLKVGYKVVIATKGMSMKLFNGEILSEDSGMKSPTFKRMLKRIEEELNAEITRYIRASELGSRYTVDTNILGFPANVYTKDGVTYISKGIGFEWIE